MSSVRTQRGRIVFAVATLFCSVVGAQSDPGPRVGVAGAGGPLPGLSAMQAQLFKTGQGTFAEIDGVFEGLGPRFNSDSCASCHAFPAIGGASPVNNPQVAFANSRNVLPSFIQPKGPIRIARFVRNADGTPDGGVHALFTIDGRADTPSGCTLKQEDFSNPSNLSLRIPTPVFGLGLIEAISDRVLVQNLNANVDAKAALGIHGRFNRNGNDGTITRFGWKAQNKSLEIFAGEAYNVEQGITNMLFPNERDDTPQCSSAGSPNDLIHLESSGTLGVMTDVTLLAAFMRFLAPPERSAITPGVVDGSNLFTGIGCAECHTPALTTGQNGYGGPLSGQTIHPYSDFAIHRMGPKLADQVSQGLAGGDEFRTAPLWGVGQRLFFLHDGRRTDLVMAILDHASPGNAQFPASEANAVIEKFDLLDVNDKQAILDFLRSL